MTVNDITFILLKVILSLGIAIFIRFVTPALRSYTEEHKNSEIYGLIETAVRAAEQTIKGTGQGSVKKEQVLETVSKWLQEKGIEITSDQLDQMIEECVYLMNHS